MPRATLRHCPSPALLAAILIGGLTVPAARALQPADLPPEPDWAAADGPDWLLDPTPYRAGLFQGAGPNEIVLANGLIRRAFRTAPNGATIALDNLVTGESVLRGVKPEARVTIDGTAYNVGGLIGQPNYAYLDPAWLDGMSADPEALALVGMEATEPRARLSWRRVRHHDPHAAWPPRGVHLRMDYQTPTGPEGVTVSVHYELYDGLPVYSKWLTVANGGERSITINSFTAELLAAVEYLSRVEDRGAYYPPPNIHVETDYAFGGFDVASSSRHIVHWVSDPDYATQVTYLRTAPCLLEVRPDVGPEQDIAPGETFETCRAFVLPQDSYERERQGLSVRRMYRVIAPWTTENPLMMHVRQADEEAVHSAIDQCAEVGFELVIMSFGSGFNIENDSPEYLEQMKRYAEYAASRGIQIGGYSLLSSRSIGGGNDIVSPEGQSPTHGSCPALTSAWGQEYFRKLYQFYDVTGQLALEHDGSYPGDIDVTPRPPLQKGALDSQWVQWRIISDFYKWCRGRGVFLNVPDSYYLVGSNKCGMGYRETNWSLPREQQVIHTRQNIYDGTWDKLGSMGWMFVPLTEYHGGGEAATVEPLRDHLDHYRNMLLANLGAGVQACYRGPRLYDAPETAVMVKECIDWYKAHREVLEGDLIHLRRPDGRDLDYWLMVNPRGREKGLLMVYNPLPQERTKSIRVPLYYAGLEGSAMVTHEGAEPIRRELASDRSLRIEVTVPAGGTTYAVFE